MKNRWTLMTFGENSMRFFAFSSSRYCRSIDATKRLLVQDYQHCKHFFVLIINIKITAVRASCFRLSSLYQGSQCFSQSCCVLCGPRAKTNSAVKAFILVHQVCTLYFTVNWCDCVLFLSSPVWFMRHVLIEIKLRIIICDVFPSSK